MIITHTFYLLGAAFSDLRFRKIPIWLYISFGIAGVLENYFMQRNQWLTILPGLLPGLLLLGLTKCSRGAVGEGDGLFFLVSAIYLGFGDTVRLLLFGLLFCSAWCLGMVVWGMFSGVSVRKLKLPFIPFLLPAWFWMCILK